ncbi:hypothetical protein Glove_199g148 [Diversispora epigaea]|uniref:Uncharacterized protein n=1 Tax=Diversispora epigaea TaxID=1348612 RepID=A0A397IQ12_9GLOM|nr:hypothetical protein Glove_199g148 [Diversispora epigaea]
MGSAIDKEISLNTYLKFCESEPHVIAKYCLIDGKIVADESYASVHGKLICIIGGWNNQLTVSVERDVIVDARSVYCSDIYVRPNYFQPLQLQQPQPLRAGRHYSNLAVEIGNTESLRSLHETFWVVFKYEPQFNYIWSSNYILLIRMVLFALLALLYSRNNPIPAIPIIVKSYLSIPAQNYLQNNY